MLLVRSFPCRVLPAALLALLVTASASAQSTGSQYVTFWRGDLRIFATQPDTTITLIDIATGLPLSPAAWTGNFATNPFTLANAGDSFEGNTGSTTLRVRIVSEDATGAGLPKPSVAWTGWLAASIKHPAAPPVDQNSWASYIPDVQQGVAGSVGGELGMEFLGFTSRDLFVFARKNGAPVSITVQDLPTNTDTDSDDNYVFDRTSPFLIYEDADVEIYRCQSFEDDTIRITSTVPASVLAGLIGTGFPDWLVSPPSYGAGDGGRELGTEFYFFSARWLAVMPVEDNTTVEITDLSDGDDTQSFFLANGHRSNPLYEMVVADPTGRNVTDVALPRTAAPAVTFQVPTGGALEQDLVRVRSDRPVLVHVGPIASDTNEFADVAYSIPTGPTSQLIHAYVQNGGANDIQLFSLSDTNNIKITSLSHTSSMGTSWTDFSIPAPTPYEGGNATTADWFWSTAVFGGELVRIESDGPVQVMSGDYDGENFGSFIPFVAAATTLPPRASAGWDQQVCPGIDVTLDGSGSFDGDMLGGSFTPAWSWDLDVATDSSGNGVPDDDADASGQVVVRAFPLGTWTVKLTFTDDDGESDADLVTVTVIDRGPPTLDCPPTWVAPATDFTGGMTSPRAFAVDDCQPPLPVIVNDRTPGGGDATDWYPCGSTAVTFTATDAAGQSVDCTTIVTLMPPGALERVGPALRVRKVSGPRPELDWTLVGAPAPSYRFTVRRSDVVSSGWLIAPGTSSWPGMTWIDDDMAAPLVFYDVRSVICNGVVSED